MTARSGMIWGFLLGVAVSLVGSGVLAYSIYQDFLDRIAPEAVKNIAVQTLSQRIGQPVQIDSASVSFPNLLQIEGLRLDWAEKPIVQVNKVEAVAEGGVEGLQKGQFVTLRSEGVSISLEKGNSKWNLTDFISTLNPASSVVSQTSENLAAYPFPLTLVEVKDFTVNLGIPGIQNQSALHLEQLVLSRKSPGESWEVRGVSGSLRIESQTDHFALKELLTELSSLAVIDSSTNGSTPASIFQSVDLDDLQIQLVASNQSLSVDHLSVQMKDLLNVISFQTGMLEKKNLISRT